MNAIFSIGSNMGDRKENLSKAAVLIGKRIGKVQRLSKIYESQAWGNTDLANFCNQVLVCETDLDILEIATLIHSMEKDLGRKKTKTIWQSRLIDIDLLFKGDQIFTSRSFHVPHKQLHLRKFVLVPLMDVAADFIHPVFKKRTKELLEICPDELNLWPLEDG